MVARRSHHRVTRKQPKVEPMKTDKVTKSVGKHPNLTGGSRKGIPNKVTADVKAMILKALDDAGGAAYLLT